MQTAVRRVRARRARPVWLAALTVLDSKGSQVAQPIAGPRPPEGAETVDDVRGWGTLLAKSFMRFDVESEEPQHFRGSFRVRDVASVEFIGMSTGGHVSHRDAASIEDDGRADYLVCLQVAGEGEFTQGGRSAVVRPGDLTFFDTTRPATVASTDGYRSLCVRVPQRLVDVPRAGMGELSATRFAVDDGLMPAIATMLRTFDAVSDEMAPHVRSLAAHNAIDLLTTLFRSRLGAGAPARRWSPDHELADMLEYIDRHLFDPDLSPSVVAAAHYMSLRRAHEHFHDAGLTISARILRRRLERCRRDLLDPAKAAEPVAAVGLRWGFRTPSQFGRAFRDAFGDSPAAYRARLATR